MRLVYAVLLCLSCAAPRQYMDGAPMRPPAPIVVEPGATPPGTGLPEYWAPLAERMPDVQPNPRPRRYLPPSREPGLWSAEEPQASSDPVNRPELFDLPVPLPDGGISPLPASICASNLSAAARDAGAHAEAIKIPEPMRQCLIGHLMVECTQREFDKARGAPDSTVHMLRWEAAKGAAVRHKAKSCKVAPLDDAAVVLLDQILKQWRRGP